MTRLVATQPIGIFDSGIGGLTVAHAVLKELPQENLVYFGDTVHLPYGDKSVATIQSYAIKIAHMLLQQQCKLILIACNSASTAAFDLVKETVGNQAIVMNVIDPVVQLLSNDYAHKKIGLIGTRQTVNSNVYQKRIDEKNCGIELKSFATNLLASAIEEFGNHTVIDSLLNEYLSHATLKNLDALVLACTHYPIVKEKINHYFNASIKIIDPSEAIAHAVKACLTEKKLLNTIGKSTQRFYVSEYTESFAANTQTFFRDTIVLEHYPLWE